MSISKENKRIGGICLACAVLFSWVGGLFTISTKNILLEETQANLEEIAAQGVKLIQKQVESDLNTLMILSREIAGKPVEEHRMDRLCEECSKHGFYRIGIADINGRAVTTDGYEFSVADSPFFGKVLAGGSFVSGPVEAKKGSEEIGVMYAVPILRHGTVDGVLFGGHTMDSLFRLINMSFYGGSSVAYIIDNDGTILVHPDKSLLKRNIFTILKENNRPEEVEQFQKKIQANHSGFTEFQFTDSGRFSVYATLDNKGTEDNPIKDWNLIVSVPEDVVFVYAARIINRMVVASCAGILLISAILFYIFYLKKKNEKKIMELAFCDGLTGVGNENWFLARCSEVLHQNKHEQYGIIYFDIDNFKVLNDTFGYKLGDRILCKIAGVLNGSMTDGEIYARIGSDNFAVFSSCGSAEDMIERCKAIQYKIRKSLDIRFEIVLSCGIYLLIPGETDVNKALNKANMARSAIKGKQDYYAVYSEEIGENIAQSAILAEEMKKALEENQFEVAYQPKYSLKNGAMVGCEALLRWHHSEYGNISPGLFIPVAENCGLIDRIGRFVWDAVCQDIRGWIDAGMKTVPVSINLSRSELYREGTLQMMTRTLADYQIPHSLIEVEITETAALENLKSVKHILREIREDGFLISMDDFGTGYSSLSCLKEMPIDILKLDRSFLADIESDRRGMQVTSFVIALAHTLNLKVVIEGVETKEQAEIMRELNCDVVQGFYFSRPLSKPEYAKKLACGNAVWLETGDNPS